MTITWKHAAIAFLFALAFVNHRLAAFMVVALLLIYFAIEFGWGGGSPNHKDHNRRHGPF